MCLNSVFQEFHCTRRDGFAFKVMALRAGYGTAVEPMPCICKPRFNPEHYKNKLTLMK